MGWGRFALRAVVVGLVGVGGGYLLATRILYPAPPPPADLVEVPDLRGADLFTAAERLAAVGLALGATDSLSYPGLGRDGVLGQSPLPGQLALPGREVRVTVSLAPRARPIPDVRRLELARAQVILEAAGFTVGVDSVESEVPRGRVVSTHPQAETPASVPSEVRISVSRGPPQVLMPYLVGMDEIRAMAVLDSVGLVLGEVDEVEGQPQDRGMVVGHEPAAGTPLERGSAVRLAVGRRDG